MINKAEYLKEISISLLTEKKLEIQEVKNFLLRLIILLKMQLVEFVDVVLPPGFEIFSVIKESHLSFGYWPERNFVRMHVCSCKNYDVDVIINKIKEYFNTDLVDLTVIKDCSLEKEIEKMGINYKYNYSYGTYYV